MHSKYTCRCEEFLQSMGPIRDSRTVSGGSMSGHRFIVTLFAGTTRKKDPCRFGFFYMYGRNRIDIREQDEFQSVWTFTHLIHGTNRFVSFSDVIVASSRSRVINIPDNGPLSLDRENEPRRQARKKNTVFWGTWSGGWGGTPYHYHPILEFSGKVLYPGFFLEFSRLLTRIPEKIWKMSGKFWKFGTITSSFFFNRKEFIISINPPVQLLTERENFDL